MEALEQRELLTTVRTGGTVVRTLGPQYHEFTAVDSFGASYELKYHRSHLGGDLRRTIDGEEEVWPGVKSFQIIDDNLHLTWVNDDIDVVHLQSDLSEVMARLMDQASEGGNPQLPDGAYGIGGATSVESRLLNPGGQVIAREVLDSVGAIFAKDGLGRTRFIGSGTVLAWGGNRYVLTADHVARAIVGNVSLLFDVRRFDDGGTGAIGAGLPDNPRGDVFHVVEITFGNRLGNRDLALLALDRPVNNVVGAVLPNFSAIPGNHVLTVGYGLGTASPQDTGEDGNRRFGFAAIDAISQGPTTVCNHQGTLCTPYAGQQLIHEYAPGEAFTRPGDSGGPDFQVLEQSARLFPQPIIVGVHSWGNDQEHETGSVRVTGQVAAEIKALIPYRQDWIPAFDIHVHQDSESGVDAPGEWHLKINLNGQFIKENYFEPHDDSWHTIVMPELGRSVKTAKFHGWEDDSFFTGGDDDLAEWTGEVDTRLTFIGNRRHLGDAVKHDNAYSIYLRFLSSWTATAGGIVGAMGVPGNRIITWTNLTSLSVQPPLSAASMGGESTIALSDAAMDTTVSSARQLDENYEFESRQPDFDGAYGNGEKWITTRDYGLFYITPLGELFHVAGETPFPVISLPTAVAVLTPQHFDNPDLLIRAGDPDVLPPDFIEDPGDVVAKAAAAQRAAVSFSIPTAVDGRDGEIPVTCSHASGDEFPIGSTTVTCTANDQSGNASTYNFAVIVRRAEDVDQDDFITPSDALHVINKLLTDGPGSISTTALDSPDAWLDVDNDGYLSPSDALAVLNWLLAPPDEEEAEGEAMQFEFVGAAPSEMAFRPSAEPTDAPQWAIPTSHTSVRTRAQDDVIPQKTLAQPSASQPIQAPRSLERTGRREAFDDGWRIPADEQLESLLLEIAGDVTMGWAPLPPP